MRDEQILEDLNIESKNKYEESIKTFADQLASQITMMKTKVDEVEHSARDKYHEKIDQLTAKKEAMMQQYDLIKETSEEKWDAIKDEKAAKVDSIKEETQRMYTGIKDGFNYLFDAIKKA